MNIAQLYSLSSGQRLDKIHTLEKFFPIPYEDFIVFAPISKQSKNYDYWVEVLSIIQPILEKNNIKILQVGAKGEVNLPYCINLQGQTNWGQLQYLISKSKLVLSTDTAASHLAGHYNKPLTVLISNNFKETVSPFYGDKSKQIILEPDRIKKNPSFMLDEGSNKQINEIKPEDIAFSVLKLLNLPYTPEYKTIEIGNQYLNKCVEIVPDQVINPQNLGIPFLVIRGDLNFNEQNIFNQISIIKSVIFTDRPLNPQALQQLKNNIIKIIYVLKKEISPDPNFCKFLQNIKIPFELVSWEKEEIINNWKLDFLDVSNGPIMKQSGAIPPKLDLNNIERYYVKSNKILLSNQLIYNSVWSYKNNFPQKDFNPVFQQIKDINLEDLWTESNICYFAEKV